MMTTGAKKRRMTINLCLTLLMVHVKGTIAHSQVFPVYLHIDAYPCTSHRTYSNAPFAHKMYPGELGTYAKFSVTLPPQCNTGLLACRPGSCSTLPSQRPTLLLRPALGCTLFMAEMGTGAAGQMQTNQEGSEKMESWRQESGDG